MCRHHVRIHVYICAWSVYVWHLNICHAPESCENFFRKLRKLSAWMKPPEKFSVLQSMQNRIKMQNGKNGGEDERYREYRKYILMNMNECTQIHTYLHVFTSVFKPRQTIKDTWNFGNRRNIATSRSRLPQTGAGAGSKATPTKGVNMALISPRSFLVSGPTTSLLAAWATAKWPNKSGL